MTVRQKAPPALDTVGASVPLAVEAKLFRGLADPARLRILMALRAGPMAPGDLAVEIGLTASNTSNHLLCLLECGLLTVESRGRHNLYRLADPAVGRLLDAGTGLLEVVGAGVQACLQYGPPSRRALRQSSGVRTVVPGAPPSSRRLVGAGRRRSTASATRGAS